MSADDGALRALLASREERAFVQRAIICATRGCVVQIAANVPGWPKRLAGDADAVLAGEAALTASLGLVPDARVSLVNASGVCAMLGVSALDPRDVKLACVAVERSAEWGRALDIDVVTERGPISRQDVGMDPRTCLLCGREAKVCARERTHGVIDLRREAGRLLRLAR